jgi:Ca-activated chloride channel family protein
MSAEIQFLRPLWFLALIPLPVLLWQLARMSGRAEAWRGLVDAHLLEHLLSGDGARVRRLPLVLLAFGWILGVAALAGPVWERLPQPVFQTEAQRVIVLDISAGMNAQDLPPSRLARARFEVLDMLEQAAEGQTALLVYGAEPFVVSPLTEDADTIAAQVPDLETALMPVQGAKRTDLALKEAGGLLRRAGSLDGDIILVTDSLEQADEAQETAADLRADGYRISVLGVGTEKGAPVPLPDGGFLTDERGAIALPRLRRDQLHALAEDGGGRYVELSADDTDTRALLPEKRDRLSERASEQDARADQWREEGPWLLLALLPLGALAFRRGWLSPVVLVVLTLPHPEAGALGWDDLWWRADQQGARAFSAGEPDRAAERFERPDWRAAAQYESGEYEQALESLRTQIGPEAAYNRGNALARLGSLEEAIEQYERVLAEEPEHEDALHNRDLLRRLLEQQEAQQEAQRQEPQDQTQSRGGEQGRNGQQGDQPGEQQQSAKASQEDQDDHGGQSEQQSASSGGQSGDSEQPRDQPQDQGRDSQDSAGGSERSDQQQSPGRQPAGSRGEPGRDEFQPTPPGASDEREEQPADEDRGRTSDPFQGSGDQNTSTSPETREPGVEPDLDDLLGGGRSAGQASAAPASDMQQGSGEDRQAMEHMLRRVPDDPGGLLRQRFLLQHLRRNGRLP